MKNLITFVLLMVALPVLAIGVSVSVLTSGVAAPGVITAVADSGERWYDPFSWSLDESAALAAAAANAAQANSVSYTTALMWALVVGLVVAAAVTATSQNAKPAYDKYAAAQAEAKAEDQAARIKLQEAAAAAEAAAAEAGRGEIPEELPPSEADVQRHARRQARHPATV